MEESKIPFEQDAIHQTILNNEDKNILSSYFTNIFDSIATKEDTPYISIKTLEKYLDIPLIICDKIYYYFDTEKENKLSKDNFTNNFIKLYSNNLQTKLYFFTHFFDFQHNNYIHIENLKIIFYYFHSITNNSTFNQIDKMIDELFSFSYNHTTFTCNEFSNVIYSINSDLFFLFFIFFSIYKPFNSHILKQCQKLFKLQKENKTVNKGKLMNENISNTNSFPITTSLISYLSNEFSSLNNIIEQYFEKYEDNKKYHIKIADNCYTFVNEHLILNNNIYPLKNSFIETERNLITLYLCNETSIHIDIEESSETDINKLCNAYTANHYCPKIDSFYYIKEKIGDGQFGQIKLCVSNKTNENYALKIIDKENKKINIQWEKDISKLLMKIHSDNVIQCYDVFETKKFLFIIYEYMPKGNLNQFLFSTTSLLTSSQINAILIDVIKGLSFLNKFYIIHRDIKPDNILISNQYNFVLTDFGFGKVVPFGEKTDEGFGTPCYASPEIISRKVYDKATDLWSIGVLAYYLVYGQLPFDDGDSNLYLIKMKIINCDYTLVPPVIEEEENNYQFAFDVIRSFLKHDNERITIEEFMTKMSKYFNN